MWRSINEVVETYQSWLDAGSPGIEDWRLIVTADGGQTLALTLDPTPVTPALNTAPAGDLDVAVGEFGLGDHACGWFVGRTEDRAVDLVEFGRLGSRVAEEGGDDRGVGEARAARFGDPGEVGQRQLNLDARRGVAMVSAVGGAGCLSVDVEPAPAPIAWL
jgi:hypothetical protein